MGAGTWSTRSRYRARHEHFGLHCPARRQESRPPRPDRHASGTSISSSRGGPTTTSPSAGDWPARSTLPPFAVRSSFSSTATKSCARRSSRSTASRGSASLPRRDVDFALTDLSGVAAPSREAELTRCLAEEIRHPFDLAAGPLSRTRLIRLAQHDHALVLVRHHTICGGESGRITARELGAAYDALKAGRAPDLPPVAGQHADYAEWQREHLTRERLDALETYWRQRLAGAPAALTLPTDRPRPAVRHSNGAWVSFRIGPDLARALHALADSAAVTLHMTLLAAFQVLLGRYAEQDDVLVGSPVSAFGRREFRGLMGFLVNIVVHRGDLGGDPTFRALLQRTRSQRAGGLRAPGSADRARGRGGRSRARSRPRSAVPGDVHAAGSRYSAARARGAHLRADPRPEHHRQVGHQPADVRRRRGPVRRARVQHRSLRSIDRRAHGGAFRQLARGDRPRSRPADIAAAVRHRGGAPADRRRLEPDGHGFPARFDDHGAVRGAGAAHTGRRGRHRRRAHVDLCGTRSTREASRTEAASTSVSRRARGWASASIARRRRSSRSSACSMRDARTCRSIPRTRRSAWRRC